MTRVPALALALAVCLASGRAQAEPLRLRGDALASVESPVGLLVLDGEGGVKRDVSAEAMVWLGADGDGLDGDALVMAIIARRHDGRAELRVGRFVTTAGALRPVHVDGASARVRLPYRLDAEVFSGLSVIPRFNAFRNDWVAGGRVGRRLGDWGGFGVAFLEERDRGVPSTRELGVDASAALGRSDLAGRVALDLIDPALADVTLTARRKVGPVRVELSADHRLASHLIPATSLFSVLGDVASERVGAALRWRAAPRLDLLADGGARRFDGDTAADGLVRATLRLDDAGKGALSAELRRTGAVEGGWTGGRLAARIPCGPLTAALEAELVKPDQDRGHGTLWPWAMTSLGWSRGLWDAAIAGEASSTPTDRYRLDVLAQVGRRWEVP
ncbi:MAG TPA: hypothetical protein VHE35_02585 [Kofleriaceae bacterium]|nr:hypothetical protein [Kofleriaceae bacterium]